MSAFIVDDETINVPLGFLNQAQHRQAEGAAFTLRHVGYQVDDTDQLQQLGEAMYQLNLEAVRQRYPGEADDTLPGPIGPKEYTFRLCHYRSITHGDRVASIPITVFQALKSLECWHYQCAEDVITERPLYLTMERVISDLQSAIIRNLPEYESAKWG